MTWGAFPRPAGPDPPWVPEPPIPTPVPGPWDGSAAGWSECPKDGVLEKSWNQWRRDVFLRERVPPSLRVKVVAHRRAPGAWRMGDPGCLRHRPVRRTCAGVAGPAVDPAFGCRRRLVLHHPGDGPRPVTAAAEPVPRRQSAWMSGHVAGARNHHFRRYDVLIPVVHIKHPDRVGPLTPRRHVNSRGRQSAPRPAGSGAGDEVRTSPAIRDMVVLRARKRAGGRFSMRTFGPVSRLSQTK